MQRAKVGTSKTQKFGEAPWSKTSDTEEAVCWAGVSRLEEGQGHGPLKGMPEPAVLVASALLYWENCVTTDTLRIKILFQDKATTGRKSLPSSSHKVQSSLSLTAAKPEKQKYGR